MLRRPFKVSFILMIFSMVCYSLLSQENLKNIKEAFSEYNNYSLREKIFTHTDKDVYLAGEIMWFKLYVVNAGNNKPIDLSKVAYVEVLDREQKPVVQTKIEISEGKAKGSLYLPLTLNSGVYKFRAYTNWMKNFGADYYFEKSVTIINTLKNSGTQPAAFKNYDVQFFPEGGDLVQGLKSKIAFRIVDQTGKGIDSCRGFVIDRNNDTVTSFHPLKFGIGNFIFTPAAGNAYKTIIELPDTSFTKELPAILGQGYVMQLNSISEFQLRVSITTNISFTNILYLFIHSGQEEKIAEKINLVNGTAEFIIDKNKLGSGISHLTIFNSYYQPVCERLFFVRPSQKLIIQSSTDEQEFASRKKVTLKIGSTDESQKSLSADLSLSVYRVDSLQNQQEGTIDNYFWLTSELKGNIESPGYYFSEKGSEVDEAIDNLMLTHGWRRFKWQQVLRHERQNYSFVPEYRGHIIYGKVTNIKTGLPVANKLVYLSVPGSRVQLYSSKSDSAGVISFYTKDFYGSNEIVLQTDEAKDTSNKIELFNPFSDKFSGSELPVLNLSPKFKNLLSDYNVNMQVQNAFIGEKLKQIYLPVIDSTAFFGNPDVQYSLDNYTRYSTMEEVLREYVYEVLVRRQKENFHFVMADVDNKIFLDDPFTLINGVPVRDPNKVIKYDPLKVKRIDIVKRKYFYGPLIMNGIINFITYQPDADLNPAALEYEGLQYQREFYSPVYETQEHVSGRLPDFRNVLYWSPDVHTDAEGKKEVSFFTGDLKGKFVVVLQGMSGEGRFGEKEILFEVK